MNRDSHLLFEAYRKVNEGFEYFGHKASKDESNEVNSMANEAGEEPKKSKHSRSHYEGAAKVVHHVLKDKHEASELAEHMKKHMKKIYGDDYDEKKAEHAIKKATGVKAKSEDYEEDEGDYPLEDDGDEDTRRQNRQDAKRGNFSRSKDNDPNKY